MLFFSIQEYFFEINVLLSYIFDLIKILIYYLSIIKQFNSNKQSIEFN